VARYPDEHEKWLRLATTAARLRTPWKTVHHYYYFRTWGLEKAHGRATYRCARASARPHHAKYQAQRCYIVDSQSVKFSAQSESGPGQRLRP
jgi:hypothetical protein